MLFVIFLIIFVIVAITVFAKFEHLTTPSSTDKTSKFFGKSITISPSTIKKSLPIKLTVSKMGDNSTLKDNFGLLMETNKTVSGLGENGPNINGDVFKILAKSGGTGYYIKNAMANQYLSPVISPVNKWTPVGTFYFVYSSSPYVWTFV